MGFVTVTIEQIVAKAFSFTVHSHIYSSVDAGVGFIVAGRQSWECENPATIILPVPYGTCTVRHPHRRKKVLALDFFMVQYIMAFDDSDHLQ